MEQQQQQQQHQQKMMMEELRSEVLRGREQIRQLDEKLQNALISPAILFPALISDAAAIISTFSSVICKLNRPSVATEAATTTAAPIPLKPPQALQLPTVSPSSSPMICSPEKITTTVLQFPGLSVTPPHSPAPSPHASSGSPVVTPATTPGSPVTPTQAPLSLSEQISDPEEQSFHDQQQNWRSNRKRKCMPRRVVNLPVNSNDQGGETPADDGFTWRKYGQKDILNAKFPRSYYRCTHQKEMGCPATKYVQKCENDVYQVTYIGDHSCQSTGGVSSALGNLWSSSHSPSKMIAAGAVARPLLDSIQSFQLGNSSNTTSPLSARLEDMKAARLALSPSRAAPTPFNLLRPSSGALISPSQWLTPKFGGLSCPIKPEPSMSASLSLLPQRQQQHQEDKKSSRNTEQLLVSPSPVSGACSASSEYNTTSSIPNTTGAGGPELHELWNLDEISGLPGLLDNKVVVDTSTISVSASLEHIPMIGAYDEDDNHFNDDPMMFEPTHQA